ncbi:MAG: 7-carboxy-7-deazaguanine synthase QueE [Nitrososphaerales archaeon]
MSEIFYSIQGEGTNLGVPSVFLRLAVCNLSCSWCDTKYTWDWQHYEYNTEVKEMTIVDVLGQILRHDCKHLVITGGEPMLQQDELAILLPSLKREGFEIEIETNGTILPIDPVAKNIDQWNLSPKIANSGNATDAREKPDVYAYFKNLPNSYFKYVVESNDDLQEILNLVAKYRLPARKVMLMPEAVTEEKLREKSAWLAEVCKNKGFRFTTRLQIILYGNKRAT